MARPQWPTGHRGQAKGPNLAPTRGGTKKNVASLPAGRREAPETRKITVLNFYMVAVAPFGPILRENAATIPPMPLAPSRAPLGAPGAQNPPNPENPEIFAPPGPGPWAHAALRECAKRNLHLSSRSAG